MTDHAELRRVAALAHPDAEWFIARNLDHPNIDKPAASFIASATPKTVLALLDEIDRLKAENEALLLGMRAILNAYDYADQYNKEGVAVEVMEDLRTLFKGATK
ncbi:TPA: ead/Ea22-like family protein [Pseudomonas aeruginosa]